MKNNDFDFIKREIENDNIIAPDELSSQTIAKMIEHKSLTNKPKLISRPYFRAVAMAACVAILFAIAKMPYNREHDCTGEVVKPDQSQESVLPTFNNYDEIEKKLIKNAVILEGYGESADVSNTLITDGSTQINTIKTKALTLKPIPRLKMWMRQM